MFVLEWHCLSDVPVQNLKKNNKIYKDLIQIVGLPY